MAKSNNQINKENDLKDNSPDSPAVIAYRLGQVESAVKDGFEAHNVKLDSVINNFSTKAEFKTLEVRISSLESDRTWISRKIIGAIIIAFIGSAFGVYGLIK